MPGRAVILHKKEFVYFLFLCILPIDKPLQFWYTNNCQEEIDKLLRVSGFVPREFNKLDFGAHPRQNYPKSSKAKTKKNS